MAKQDASTLPTLDDFTVVDTLRNPFQDVEDDIQVDETEEEKEARELKEVEEAEKAEAKLKAEAEAKKKKVKPTTDKTEEEKKAEELKKAEEAKLKAEEERKKKAPQLTEEQLAILVKKAEATPEALTVEERQLLIDKELFQEDVNFWEEVEKESGIKVPVDFGDVDPESPKGAALRDQALMDIAAQQQLDFLKTTYPDAYQIMEHVANGGSVRDLVNPDEPDFSKIKLEKDDKDSQKDLLLDFYLSRGFDEKRAQRMVEADEDSAEGLFVTAEDALKQMTAAQQERQKVAIARQAAIKEDIEKQNVAYRQTIKNIAEQGKLGDFTITDKKDKEGFFNFVVQNSVRDPKNGYQIVMPINDKSIMNVLQQMYFAYKGGKLDSMIQREAKTLTTRKLVKTVKAAKITGGEVKGDDETKTGNKLPTFESFTV